MGVITTALGNHKACDKRRSFKGDKAMEVEMRHPIAERSTAAIEAVKRHFDRPGITYEWIALSAKSFDSTEFLIGGWLSRGEIECYPFCLVANGTIVDVEFFGVHCPFGVL
jgi:hypothetical protein